MRNQLTRQDIAEMEAEIAHRRIDVRKELLEDVKTARAHGDLSENFEYYAAKKAKNQNESRIRYLERMIRTAEVIDDKTAAAEAGVGKTVRIRVEEDGSEEQYKLVTTMRGDSLKGLISIESPLGKALLGHRAGERITVRVSSDYSYDAQILSVENTGVTADDKIREF